jgi:DNA-binding beta-propeller fold protein YncE
MRFRPLALAVVGAILVAAGAALAQSAFDVGRVGPRLGLLANGRALTPLGRQVSLGNFPTGGALTPDGRFYWTVSTGRGLNDIRIVSLTSRKVVQVLPLPGASGGIAMDRTRRVAYVSGVADSDHKDAQVPKGKGRGGDVIHLLAYTRAGAARELDPIPVPAPGDTPAPQAFPPTDTLTKKISWPGRLAVARDGKHLLVPLNLADRAAVVDLPSKRVRYVPVGSYPYGAAILPDQKTGLVTNEAAGTVSVINLQTAQKVKDIQVAGALSHPEAVITDVAGKRGYVAIANADQVAVLDLKTLTVERTLSVARPEGDGVSPVDVALTPDGSRLLVAEAGADEIAVFGVPGSTRGRTAAQRRADAVLTHELRAATARDPGHAAKADNAAERAASARVTARPAESAFPLIGRIPVGSYPADVEVSRNVANACDVPAIRRRRRTPPAGAPRRCPKLVWVAGKGAGVGPNPKGPNPYVINDDNALSQNYLPSIVNGRAGIADMPSDASVRALTPAASKQLRPSNPQTAPADTPLRPDGPIKHVFYIVRENRTYDQVLGDDARGDGAPDLTIFGNRVTPNMHALVNRFPLLDHVYANSEASIDGHFWTSAAKVSDYVHKNWNQNYGGRGRPYDFGVFSVTWPSNGFIFDQLQRQGISYFNFGEAVAGVVPLTDKDRDGTATAEVAAKFAKSDIGAPIGCYANDAFIFKNSLTQNSVSDASVPAGYPLNTESRFDCFKSKFGLQLATSSVPAFTYITLPMDHTQGGGVGTFTPRAYVANNDLGLGQMVDLISHSSIWSSSAIFVIEDDSQDGADHIDAHRIPAAVISPYAKRGAVVHTRYDFLSVIRSMGLILGMKPLGLFDNLATPMYDAFSGTPDNAAAYDVKTPTWDLAERNKASSAAARLSHGLNLSQPDRVPQRILDRILWKTIYGDKAEPPPSGPNATPGG